MALKVCPNRNLKVNGFWFMFWAKNDVFNRNILIISRLSEYPKYSKNASGAFFLNVLSDSAFC